MSKEIIRKALLKSIHERTKRIEANNKRIAEIDKLLWRNDKKRMA